MRILQVITAKALIFLIRNMLQGRGILYLGILFLVSVEVVTMITGIHVNNTNTIHRKTSLVLYVQSSSCPGHDPCTL